MGTWEVWHNALMRDLPVACSLSADELGVRRQALLPGLLALATGHHDLEQGRRLTFPPAAGTLDALARVIEAERHCCPFLRFALTVDQGGAPITLDITGPSGTKEFLTDLLSQSA
jgi:hypothetical protein